MSWPNHISSELIDVRDGTHDSPKYVSAGYPLITSKNLINGVISLDDVNYVTKEDYDSINKRSKVDAGDVLYSMIGSIGNYAYVEEEPNFAIKNVALFKFKDDRLYTPYFLHLLNSPIIFSQIEKEMKGGTQKFITLKILRNLKIPLPPLATQKKIAAILDAADAHRQKTKQLLAKYDELAQSIFLEMFGEIEGEDFSMLELSDTSEKGTFSNGPFGSDLLTSELTNQGIPVIYIRDIRNGEFQWKSQVFITNEKAQYLKNCQVKQGDVLIAKVGDPPGATAIYPNDALAVITQDVIRLRPNLEKVTPEFLQFWFNSKLGLRVLQPIIVQGTRQRFGLGDLKKIRLKVPSISKQRYFSKIIEGLNSQLLIGRNQYLESENLFNSLLQKAFKGELVK
ncbi:restriction endonuclease subunit S [uncultured Cyclobacterium sp.]|uniref:restriction endonuclease subunit S n=1 Tax=uncultured Cyclobacterium sp. TaxID=453820 RepID=UPI0030EC353F